MGIKVTRDAITPSLKKIAKNLESVPKETADEFRKNTPKRTGNARRKTKLRNGNKIVADYNYAKPLERGHSRQAPRGMAKPTEEFFIRLIKKIMRK